MALAPPATMATYCFPFFPWYVIGTACALISSFVVHSSLPVLESKARNRLSFVAPMNTRPPAVAIGPPMLRRPVFFLPSGNSSVIPNGTFHAMSPVFAFTAMRLPHGGFWHGHACAPELLMLPERGSPSLH